MSTPDDRRAIHCYVTHTGHDEWNFAADEHGLTVSAIIQALAPRINALLTTEPTLAADARKVDASRRRRTR